MRCKVLFLIGALIMTSNAFAWNNAVNIGYGYGKELNEDYINKGYFLNLTFYKFQLDSKLDLTINGSAGYWKSETELNNKLYTFGAGIGLRAYFTRNGWINPYINVSISPSYIPITNQFSAF